MLKDEDGRSIGRPKPYLITILNFILKNRFDVDLIHLVLDTEERRILLPMGMGFQIP